MSFNDYDPSVGLSRTDYWNELCPGSQNWCAGIFRLNAIFYHNTWCADLVANKRWFRSGLTLCQRRCRSLFWLYGSSGALYHYKCSIAMAIPTCSKYHRGYNKHSALNAWIYLRQYTHVSFNVLSCSLRIKVCMYVEWELHMWYSARLFTCTPSESTSRNGTLSQPQAASQPSPDRPLDSSFSSVFVESAVGIDRGSLHMSVVGRSVGQSLWVFALRN